MTVRVPFGSGIGLDIVRSRHSSSAGGSIGEGLERRQEEGAQRLKGDGQLRRLAFRREEIPGGLLPFFERRLCVGGESQTALLHLLSNFGKFSRLKAGASRLRPDRALTRPSSAGGSVVEGRGRRE